jgi:hypothetical protein
VDEDRPSELQDRRKRGNPPGVGATGNQGCAAGAGVRRQMEQPRVVEARSGRLLIVEDVVTSGGQIIASAGELRALGGSIDTALCVIDRESGGREALASKGSALRALFRMSELRRRCSLTVLRWPERAARGGGSERYWKSTAAANPDVTFFHSRRVAANGAAPPAPQAPLP